MPASTDVLRWICSGSITAGAWRLAPDTIWNRKDLCLIQLPNSYVRHTSAKDIDIRGRGGRPAPSYVTFDARHLAAGSHLAGPYPARLMKLGFRRMANRSATGKVRTFTLLLADKNTSHAALHFDSREIFADWMSHELKAMRPSHSRGGVADKSFTIRRRATAN